MSEQENINLVKEAYADFEKGDIQALISKITDDVEWVIPGPPEILPTAGKINGPEAVAEFFSKLGETEDVELFEPKEYIAQGDKVVAISNYRARIKSTGRTAETELVHIFTVREGKISHFQEFFDTAVAVEAYRPATAGATG